MANEVTFTDNMEVTLENMNDIVKDLGDTEFSGFSTSKFGVDELNAITADVVSSGILRTEENANMGCEQFIDGNNIVISPGVIVFATGAKLRITEAETVAKINSTYIYACNDHLTGIASIIVSETAPTNQMDAVQLCRIDTNGNLIDLRSAAVAKISFTAEPQNIGVIKHISSVGGNFDFDIGFNGWKYIVYELTNSRGYADMGCLELPDGSSTRCFPTRNTDGYYDGRVIVTRNGSVLHFEDTNNPPVAAFDIDIEVR